MTAPPEELHLMLYDGAIRFTRQAVEATRDKNWEQAFNGYHRTQKILLEMINALNYDVDAELCKRMASLYNFIYKKLVEASVERDAALGEEALGLLEYQRETWVLLINKLRQEQGRATQTPAPRGPAEASAPDPMDDATYGSLSVEG